LINNKKESQKDFRKRKSKPEDTDFSPVFHAKILNRQRLRSRTAAERNPLQPPLL